MRNGEPSPSTLLIAIRAKCMDCSGNSRNEVERCLIKTCPLYPYRSVDALGEAMKPKAPTCGQIDMFDLK